MPNVRFNRKIYPAAAVKKAISAYANLADFKIFLKDNYIEVSMKKTSALNFRLLLDEFRNYCLGMALK